MNLSQKLDSLTAPGALYKKEADNALRCFACGHRCLIREGKRGICKVRFNEKGKLRVPWGYVAALQADPIEKKPFYHFLSGENALSFGMLGCDLHCDYCQNWFTSQAMRDPASDGAGRMVREVSAEQLIALAEQTDSKIIASTYNEPLITSEWAVEIFKKAKKAGLKTAMISNGHATPETLDYLAPYLDGYKIDLKSMQERNYRQLGGVLQNVLDSIIHAHKLGLWVEVVTLVVPDFNDSNAELWEAARFLAEISPNIPWHVTAYHRDYKRQSGDNTSAETLLRAADIGREAGLNYVYAGNAHGLAKEYESTYCPGCNKALIARRGFIIRDYNLTENGNCPHCGAAVAGVWTNEPGNVKLNSFGMPRVV
ncbi:MAG: AmmeMemoRadiSam system radical SAM enzyme [Anaerolineae bacterium]|jgi:pyruvate formate lyase activating enzyme|nr:AmmeMemoRadiSam system radical SAM enzyme [Anaerolineae bacterium]MBT7189023.1 AmmeMemoRadiSam system radical SAM enzyme [Anaerolineae bacterium]MBT7990296.1 AmmeMemoRadiSam system radical SAM enzyme [Anaerolineae bacterium]